MAFKLSRMGVGRMFEAQTFRSRVIDPALKKIGLLSPAASDLLLGTAIQESGGFRWVKQLGGGPARGYFQMEKATHDDIWATYLKYRKNLSNKVALVLIKGECAETDTMMSNHLYAAAMARIRYKRVPHPLPAEGDIKAMSLYWKKYYNTPLGAGSPEEYIENWNAHVKS